MSLVFPPSYLRFIELFNDEQFWESHEVLEQPWRENGSLFYKGMIIYASAFVHTQRGNPVGVRKQMVKAAGYLGMYAPHYMGLDVDHILSHGKVCLAVLDRTPPARGEALISAIPFVSLRLEEHLVRGDEPEFDTPDPLAFA